MEKKYQVFVSSTYIDLLEERQEVMQALLELDCIPVGMESFPAADEEQWSLIKRLIDDCDYYIIIIGGRYGSVNEETKISYTQMEYEYALEKEIPIIGFLHENPSTLPVNKTDQNPDKAAKLDSFKELVRKKLCKFYSSPKDLGGSVSRSLVRLIKDRPRPGWVKATQLPSEDTTKELLALRKQIEELKDQNNRLSSEAPAQSKDLSQGDDEFVIDFSAGSHIYNYGNEEFGFGNVKSNWNEIFAFISPFMVDEASEQKLREEINILVKKKLSKVPKHVFRPGIESCISKNTFRIILVQLKALGLIIQSERKRSLNDVGSYWKLTPYGDTLMTNLVAIKRSAD
jgi:hypothetical protein